MTDDITTVKVVLLGASGVGKTSIINQFVSKKFDPECLTSLSAQFTSKTFYFEDIEKSIRFDIWDTAGQEQYRSLAKIFYKEAKIIVLVYDITNVKSFNELKNFWYEQTKSECDSDVITAVVGNKYDKTDEEAVSYDEGKEFANKIGAIFQQTSALSNYGIEKLFKNLGLALIKTYNNKIL